MNIVLIMADQLRADFVGYAGRSCARTPRIDSLAARGMRFYNATTSSAVCAPARIGLATGLIPSRLGAFDNNAFLPLGVKTYYERLRDAGYRTALAGKLDLAKPDKYNGRFGDRPIAYRFGFTHPVECEGKWQAGNFGRPMGPYGFWLEEQGLFAAFLEDYQRRFAEGLITEVGLADSVLPEAAFADFYVARRAVELLGALAKDFPYYLSVHFVGPHDPFDPPPRYSARYRDAEVPPPIEESLNGKASWVNERRRDASPETMLLARRQYCAAIEALDDAVGMVLDAIEARDGLADTLVIFTSDHGEMLGDHGLFEKSVAYEGAVRIPLVVAGPRIVPESSSDAIVELIDVGATILDFAGLSLPDGIDALSIEPLLSGAADSVRDSAVCIERSYRSVRTKRWKFIDNINDFPELYDLESDPEEKRNVAGDNARVCAQLRAALLERLAGNARL